MVTRVGGAGNDGVPGRSRGDIVIARRTRRRGG